MKQEMSIREALAVLHGAGRIKSPWLPGMWTDHHVRVLDVQHDAFPRLIRIIDDEGVPEWVDQDVVGEPDTSDPATVGCLAEFMREALPDHQVWCEVDDERDPSGWWSICIGKLDSMLIQVLVRAQPTVGKAWGAGLITLAEAEQR